MGQSKDRLSRSPNGMTVTRRMTVGRGLAGDCRGVGVAVDLIISTGGLAKDGRGVGILVLSIRCVGGNRLGVGKDVCGGDSWTDSSCSGITDSDGCTIFLALSSGRPCERLRLR